MSTQNCLFFEDLIRGANFNLRFSQLMGGKDRGFGAQPPQKAARCRKGQCSILELELICMT